MRTTILILLVLLGFCGTPVQAGPLLTYESTHATARGVIETRFNGELVLIDAPADVGFEFTYDATIRGVTHGGTTTFAVPDLGIGVYVAAGNWRASAQPGTITWTGNTISFAASSGLPGQLPSVLVGMSFTGSGLTPGLLPDSLAGLEGVVGNFHADIYPSVGGYRYGTGDVTGSFVAMPEPSSMVLMAIGVAGALFWRHQAIIESKHSRGQDG